MTFDRTRFPVQRDPADEVEWLRNKADAVPPRRMERALIDFARNGHWGTCVSCPLDEAGHRLPEACVMTDQYDHLLTITCLATHIRLDENKERARRNNLISLTTEAP